MAKARAGSARAELISVWWRFISHDTINSLPNCGITKEQ